MIARRLRAAVHAFMAPETAGDLFTPDLSYFDSLYRLVPKRGERYMEQIEKGFTAANLTSGKMLEIGGRRKPLKEHFPSFIYEALDLADTGPDVVVADITNCPQIPDASYDFIISIDVFEHINAPWLAAKEISRILRPGGVTYHTTLFSWRYHPCPIDYWRYSPEALKFLFSDLQCISAVFDQAERRRNITGEGGAGKIKPDGMGGWRENWRVHYVGIKPR